MELTLNLTHACNLGCSYCNAGQKSARSMSFDTGRRAIRLALDESRSDSLNVAFFGGEPLLEFDLLLDLADVAREQAEARGRRCGFSVTTNGTLLTEARAEALASRCFHVALSVDGGPEAQDATRPFSGGRSSAAALDRALDVARDVASAHGTKLTAISVVDPRNVRHAASGVRYLVRKGMCRVTLNANWLAEWSEQDLALWAAAYEQNARFWQERMRLGRPFVLNTLDPKIWRRLTEDLDAVGGCGYGRSELAVAPSGRIYPCGRVVGDDPDDATASRRRHCLGDVTQGIDEVARQRLPTPTALPSECRACAYRARCANSCGCSNVEATGDASTPGGVICWHETLSIRLADRVASELYAERDPTFMARFYFESQPTQGEDDGSLASHPRFTRGEPRLLPLAERVR